MIDYSALNPQQHKATFSDHPRILCLAGAGTGKTQVLTRRISRLYEAGVSPENMLALTFTRAAGAEMKERVIGLIGEDGKKLFCNTFHAFCVDVIREFSDLLHFEPNFTIYDQAESEEIMQSVLTELKIKLSAKRVFDYRAGKTVNMSAIDRNRAETALSEFWMQMCRNNACDFDGLIEVVKKAGTHSPEIYAALRARYTHVFVDEFQDTDSQQWAIVQMLKPENLFVVGDDFQSIYGFRGSDISIILGLAENPGWQTVKLEQNYRSTIPIIAAANVLIKHNRQTEKTLITAKDGTAVDFREPSDAVLEIHDIVPRLKSNQKNGKTTAILARTNKQLDSAKGMLVSANVPCERLSAADNPLMRPTARQLLAWLAAIENPDDEAALHRIAASRIGKLAFMGIEKAQLEANSSFTEALQGAEAGREVLAELERQRVAYKSAENVAEGIHRLQVSLGIEDADVILAIGFWVARQCELGESTDTATLLEHIRLHGVFSSETKERTADRTYLMTVHGSKGLEFDEVFIIGAAQGTFPSGKDLEEERRLFYVAITRAREYLNISSPRLMNDWHGRPKPTSRSQFIREALLK